MYYPKVWKEELHIFFLLIIHKIYLISEKITEIAESKRKLIIFNYRILIVILKYRIIIIIRLKYMQIISNIIMQSRNGFNK